SFALQPSLPVGNNPSSVAVADVNGDGIPDVLAANKGDYVAGSSTVSVLLGTGKGAFAPQTSLQTGFGPQSLMAADLNSDGQPDLAITNFNDDSVSVLLGNGDGAFRAPQAFPAGDGPISLAAGDVNGDGRPDLVVADFNPDRDKRFFLDVLLGNGDGSFQP